MIGEDIRELQRAVPFEPYTIVTSDQNELYVKHPDYCLIAPSDQTVWVFSDEVHRQMVATRNITRIIPGARKARSRRKR